MMTLTVVLNAVIRLVVFETFLCARTEYSLVVDDVMVITCV